MGRQQLQTFKIGNRTTFTSGSGSHECACLQLRPIRVEIQLQELKTSPTNGGLENGTFILHGMASKRVRSRTYTYVEKKQMER